MYNQSSPNVKFIEHSFFYFDEESKEVTTIDEAVKVTNQSKETLARYLTCLNQSYALSNKIAERINVDWDFSKLLVADNRTYIPAEYAMILQSTVVSLLDSSDSLETLPDYIFDDICNICRVIKIGYMYYDKKEIREFMYNFIDSKGDKKEYKHHSGIQIDNTSMENLLSALKQKLDITNKAIDDAVLNIESYKGKNVILRDGEEVVAKVMSGESGDSASDFQENMKTLSKKILEFLDKDAETKEEVIDESVLKNAANFKAGNFYIDWSTNKVTIKDTGETLTVKQAAKKLDIEEEFVRGYANYTKSMYDATKYVIKTLKIKDWDVSSESNIPPEFLVPAAMFIKRNLNDEVKLFADIPKEKLVDLQKIAYEATNK